jgi:hypothetical protein
MTQPSNFGKAGPFLDQDDLATRSTAQKNDHLAEAGSAAPFGRFHVGEFLGDVDRILGCVVPEQFLLCWD